MTKDEYIDHEIRIRMLEKVNQQLVTRMNALLTVAITGLLIPVVMKYLSA